MKVIDQVASRDGSTKYLFETSPGVTVESVVFEQCGAPSICVSCQAGCNIGCVFCETGRQKNSRDLSADEICRQVEAAARACSLPRFRAVLFAGMGEPLDNFESVAQASRQLIAGGLCDEVRLVTSGIVPYMDRLHEVPISALGISLHATTNAMRTLLVPINKKYPLETVLAAGERYRRRTGNPVTVNYLLFRGLNDTAADLERLLGLLSPAVFEIKLKVWNDTGVEGLTRSDEETFALFREGLEANGFWVSARPSRGVDIQAGCGQLRSADRVERMRALRVPANLVARRSDGPS